MNRGKVEYLSSIFECEFCGLCYATESDLRIHQEGEHEGEFAPRIVSVTGNYKYVNFVTFISLPLREVLD